MSFRKKRSKKIRQILWSAFGVLVVGYFLYHTVRGERGWFAMLRIQREVSRAQETLSDLQKERAELEHRTKLLRDGSLDPDLLDEKSRELLNYSKPNEIIILTPLEERKNEDQ